MLTSIDGFFEGPNRDLNWHNVDAEFNDFAIAQLQEMDALLFGRVTYEMMASYWPTPAALEDDPVVAERMNNLPKFVASRRLTEVEWNNSQLLRSNIAEQVAELKQQPGKDLAIFGSSDLTVSLLQAGVVDELRILVNPIVLGQGKRLFEGLNQRVKLKLIKTRVFNSGNVLLYYRPESAGPVRGNVE
jgi:dihydrofolate reductase